MILITQYKLVQKEITILITIGSITKTAPPYVNLNNVYIKSNTHQHDHKTTWVTKYKNKKCVNGNFMCFKIIKKINTIF